MSTTDVRSARFYVDGPNIDATLGVQILGRKPLAHERPRWDRVRDFVVAQYGVSQLCFVMNGDMSYRGVTPFYRALKHCGFHVRMPRSDERLAVSDPDPVDACIKQELRAFLPMVASGKVAGVLLASHDHGYASELLPILRAGGTVCIVGFIEWMSPALCDLESEGAILLDLEHDCCAFDVNLNRPRFAA